MNQDAGKPQARGELRLKTVYVQGGYPKAVDMDTGREIAGLCGIEWTAVVNECPQAKVKIRKPAVEVFADVVEIVDAGPPDVIEIPKETAP